MVALTTVTIRSDSEDETVRLGEKLGAAMKKGDIALLTGELGTGKTTLTRGICRGLGISEGITVRSPTFTMIHDYPGDVNIRHVDLYRIEGNDDLESIGLFDQAFNGVTIIEWAEKLDEPESFGTIRVNVTDIAEKERKLEIKATPDFLLSMGLKHDKK